MNAITPILRPSWNLNEDSEGSGVDPGRRTKLILFSIVGIVGGAIWLFVYLRGVNRPSTASVAPFAALGEVTAQETAKLLDNKGRIVVVTRDTGQYPAPELEEQLKAFQQTVKQHPDLTLAATEKVQLDTDITDAGLSPDFYLNLLQKYPDAAAIVSFVGPPALSPQQIRTLPQKIPKFIAVSLATVPLKRLFRSDLIHVAIVNRTKPAQQSGKKPASAREQFDQYFQVVTAENADSLRF
ncbi:MAG: hypothetical protein ABSA97_08865 [Verrucomicrobiia bacterium]|jgi:hypothetical protein